MEHGLDNIEPSLGMDASLAETSIYHLRHTYLNDMDTSSFYTEDSATSKSDSTSSTAQQYTFARLPIDEWQAEEVKQWLSEVLRKSGVQHQGVNNLRPLGTLSGRQLLRLSHHDLCGLVGRQWAAILHHQLNVLKATQGSQSMLLDEASGDSVCTGPHCPSTNQDSLYSNPDAQCINPDPSYNPDSLYNPDSFYNPDSSYNPDPLYNPDSLYNLDSSYNFESLPNNSDPLYNNPDSLYNLESLQSNPDSLYSKPDSPDKWSGWRMTPEELEDLQQYMPEEPWPPLAEDDPHASNSNDFLLNDFHDLDIREQFVPIKNEEPEAKVPESAAGGNAGCDGLIISSSDMLKKIPSKTRKRVRGPKSWEFLMRLLADGRSNPALIRWEDEASATFRLTQPAIIAQMWANRTNDKRNLSYNNFARGLRHHYTTGALEPVMEKQLVYRCGPTALQYLHELRQES